MPRKALYLFSALLISSSAIFAVEGTDGGIPITQNSKMGLQEIQHRAWGVASSADAVYGTSPVMQPIFLNEIKEDIDYMQRQFAALQSEGSLNAEEREALAKSMPLLTEADEHADLALRYWNDNTDHLRGDDVYRAYLHTIKDNCKDIEKLMRSALGLRRSSSAAHKIRRAMTLGFGS